MTVTKYYDEYGVVYKSVESQGTVYIYKVFFSLKLQLLQHNFETLQINNNNTP